MNSKVQIRPGSQAIAASSKTGPGNPPPNHPSFPAPSLSSKPRLLTKHPSAYLKKALSQLNLQRLQGSDAASIWGHLADKMMAKLKKEGQNQIEPNIIMAAVFSLNARPEILRNISEQRMSGVFGCARSSLQKWKNNLYPLIGNRMKLG